MPVCSNFVLTSDVSQLTPHQRTTTLPRRISEHYTTAMDYTPHRLPADDWLTDCHIGKPAIFRDKMVSDYCWTVEQREQHSSAGATTITRSSRSAASPTAHPLASRRHSSTTTAIAATSRCTH